MDKKIKLKCYKCKHKWNSRTKSDYYVTCPNCMYKIRIDKAKENGKNKK